MPIICIHQVISRLRLPPLLRILYQAKNHVDNEVEELKKNKIKT